MQVLITLALAFMNALHVSPERMVLFEQTFEKKVFVKGWRIRVAGTTSYPVIAKDGTSELVELALMSISNNKETEVSKGGLWEKLYSLGAFCGLEWVHLVRPDKLAGISTKDVAYAWQFFLYCQSKGADYSVYYKSCWQRGLAAVSLKRYNEAKSKELFSALKMCLAHGNLLKPGCKIPVAVMGTFAQFGEALRLNGPPLIKAMLKYIKWGQPANTNSTSALVTGRLLKVFVVPEDVLKLTGWYKKHQPNYHDGALISPKSGVKLVAAMYRSRLDTSARSFKILSECQLRIRTYISELLMIVKGLWIFVSDEEWTDLIDNLSSKLINVPDGVDIITSDGNIKLGSKETIQYWASSDIDLINIAATHRSSGTFGPQGVLLNQFAAYELFSFYNWMRFRKLDGSVITRRPIEVFCELVKGDLQAWAYEFGRKEEASFEDFSITVRRALFWPFPDTSCPSGKRVPRYTTVSNTLANRCLDFLNQQVLRAKIPTRSMYITSDIRLDELILRHAEAGGSVINPIVPQNVKRVRLAIRKYAASLEYKWCFIKHPVVGCGQVAEIHFVALVDGRFELWKPEMGVASIYMGEHAAQSSMAQKKATEDNDGDMMILACYKGEHSFEIGGFPSDTSPKGGEAPLPETEAETCLAWMNMLRDAESKIGEIDLLGRQDAVDRLINGKCMSTNTSIQAGWWKETIIKLSTRMGGAKGGALQSQATFIKLFEATFTLFGKKPKWSALYNATTRGQGVWSEEEGGYVGGAGYVKGFFNNCKKGLAELDKIHHNGNTFMYKDIVTYSASKADLVLKYDNQDAYDIYNWCCAQRVKYASEVKLSAELVIWSSTLAKQLDAEYSSKMKEVLGLWARGHGVINSVEKSARFTEFFAQAEQKVTDAIDSRVQIVYNKRGISEPESASCLYREQISRLLTLDLACEGFRAARPGGAFWFTPFSCHLWLAYRWDPSNLSVLMRAADSYTTWEFEKGKWVKEEEVYIHES